VTPGNPLRITIPRQLGPGEHLLPVAFDGEFYLPLGHAHSVKGETRVILERLPHPAEAESRTLGGSLRILFQKVFARAFGTEYRYPILAAAKVGEDLTVQYEPDLSAVRAKVAKADRIVLFVHGIIGDTHEMAASLQRAGVADRYDLILTFDYENLQDPIAETAGSLKERLAAVGLGPGHGKHLDIVAHSMGGLVSRWFIEQEGGNRLVRRLVMVGTPNGGSPWPQVHDWAITALAVGLNELSKALWPATVLAGLVRMIEAVNVTLDQMVPGSGFLRDLHASPDPKIPYLLISGDTSLIAAPGGDEERRSKVQRLLSRLWSDRTKYYLADLFFSGSANDIAVSIASMKTLSAEHEPREIGTVACDHLSYFRHPEALMMLSQVLR
jgi:pimeloyl-ACP methyl ester carboxylesterase